MRPLLFVGGGLTVQVLVVLTCWMCMRRAEDAALRAERAAERSAVSAELSKNAAHRASGFRRTRQGLR